MHQTPQHPESQDAMISATEEAIELIRSLREEHGEIMFHQSGGCCDGSAPMCFTEGMFKIGFRDVKLGEVDGAPFYMGGQQYERWKHTRLILDVVPGRGASFSIEIPRGVRFVIRSEVCAV